MKKMILTVFLLSGYLHSSDKHAHLWEDKPWMDELEPITRSRAIFDPFNLDSELDGNSINILKVGSITPREFALALEIPGETTDNIVYNEVGKDNLPLILTDGQVGKALKHMRDSSERLRFPKAESLIRACRHLGITSSGIY